MIHSHHPVPKMEISFNCPGEVVVPKIFLFVNIVMSLVLFLLPFFCNREDELLILGLVTI